MNSKIESWLEVKEQKELGGGLKAIEKQHAKGKLTARERMNLLFDEGTFVEFGLFAKHRCVDFGQDKVDIPADGCVVGFGKVNGRVVYAYAHDFTAKGGTLGEIHSKKLHKVIKAAIDAGCPCVSLNDSGGGRLQEAVISQNFLELFRYNVQASGWIPQISAIMGPCAGGAAYSPALTDFVINVDQTSSMFLTGPSVIKSVTGESIDNESLGGAKTHTTISGVGHMIAVDDYDCIHKIKDLLSYLPQNADEKPPVYASTDDPERIIPELDDMIPENPKAAYDMKDVISSILDNGIFVEHMEGYAKNIITVLGRLNGKTVGIVANQPKVMAGCLDINASDKGARFIRLCDAFNIPLIWLVDVPGFLPGVNQEYGGIIRHGAKLVYACCEATVPKITIHLRKDYGGAMAAMCSKEMGADVNYIWPTGESCIMGAEGAATIIFREQIEAAPEEERGVLRQKLIDEYTEHMATPYLSAGVMVNDEIIRPSETRAVLIKTLEAFENKKVTSIKKKHGLIPM